MRITYKGLRSGNTRAAIISYAENEENKAYDIARKFTIATSYKVDTLVYGMLIIEVDDVNDFNNVKEWYKEFKQTMKNQTQTAQQNQANGTTESDTNDTTESDTNDTTESDTNDTTESDTNDCQIKVFALSTHVINDMIDVMPVYYAEDDMVVPSDTGGVVYNK